jgi:hypothetical protein
MKEDDWTRSMKTMVWGWFLIAVGVLFLLDRMAVVRLPNIGLLWPLTFLAVAAIHVVERRIGSAVMFLLIGAWFQACTLKWHGITYGKSWPLLLVAVGIGIVLRAVTGEDERLRRRIIERREKREGGTS